jgi:Fic family protein
VATIESIGSSTRIEGGQLTNSQVEALLARLEITAFESHDEQEVAGYAQVMELLFSAWEHIPFNENHIQQLHRDLLAHSTKDEPHRERYKTTSSSVGAFDESGPQVATIIETASPFDTPRQMQELSVGCGRPRNARPCIPCLSLLFSWWCFWISTRSRTAMVACLAC